MFGSNRKAIQSELNDLYNPGTDHGKGRLISLIDALLTSFYNVFITGIFYTGFLSMYDISITDFGIITFIPYIANTLSIFSPMILRRFKKRKAVLLGSKLYYYAMYILATTLMPQLVTGKSARMYCFIAIQFLAHGVYALFSTGFTTWFYNFYPADNERRTRYIQWNQILQSIMSCLVLLFSGLLTDAVAGSSDQARLILGMRYLAFVLAAADVFIQSRAREYPYPESAHLNLKKLFILPFRYRKFLFCLLLMFFWNYISALNSGLWNYHLLNHMHFSYTLINAMSMSYTLLLITTAPVWRKVLRRYSWIKTFGIANLIWVPTEVAFFFMSPDRGWMFVPLCLWQNILSAGMNLSYSNVLYMNLPEEDSTAHLAFYTIGCNVFAFLGLLTGTLISGIGGDIPMRIAGGDTYAVQFTTLARAVTQLIIGLICTLCWKTFTRESDIAEIESLKK